MAQIPFEKLRGRDNFSDWEFNVKNLFIIEGLWKSIEGTQTDVDVNLKALAKLGLLVDPINKHHIQKAKTAKEAWESRYLG